MKPTIGKTKFGWILVEDKKHKHDILIRLNGSIEKRKKKLSKDLYGTSHLLSLAEAKYIYEEGAALVLIGTGQTGYVTLTEEAAEFFKQKECTVELYPTSEAIQRWNELKGPAIGLFHVTC